MAALHTTFTEENAKDKRSITLLENIIATNNETINAQGIDIGLSVNKQDKLEESNSSKDDRIKGLLTQNASLLACRGKELQNEQEIQRITNALRISREAYTKATSQSQQT